MYFRKVGNLRNIFNCKSITNNVCIKHIYMVKIILIIHRSKYGYGYGDDIGAELLCVFGT